MTENEKIELFDKWYDENYDEWAEGEEGIALREELEQAFKSGIATLEKENAELKADNDARKFAMAMSEKVEKQLREENAELKNQLEMSNKVYNDNLDYSHHIEEQLTKAKEIIKNLVEFDSSYKDDEEYQRKSELYDKMWEEAEQFLKE